MKKYLSFSLIGLVMMACSGERKNYTTLDEDGNIVISDESVKILEEIQADYDRCKATESEERECNYFTAEAICRFYQIDDFKEGDSFVSYRDIKDVVTLRGGSWEPIGIATEQENLDKAQKNANDQKATIAFDPTKTNHVAVILPGQMAKSGSWGMDVPNSASFFVHKPESYINKGLSYSFTSPKGIILYTKK